MSLDKIVGNLGKALASGGKSGKKPNPKKKTKKSVARVKTLNSAGMTTAPSAVSVVHRPYWTQSSSSMNSLRVRGKDILGAFTLGSVPAYTSVYNSVVSPSAFPGTRMASESLRWEKYRYHNLSFCWAPQCPTTTPGGLIITYDTDPTDATPPVTFEGLRVYLSHAASVEFVPWQAACCSYRRQQDLAWYYTGPLNGSTLGGVDERLSYQGQVYLATGPATSSASSPISGTLWVEYDLEFIEPQLRTDVPTTTQTANPSAAVLAPQNDAFAPVLDASTVTQGEKSFTVRTVDIPTLGPRAALDLAAGVYEILQWAAPTGYSASSQISWGTLGTYTKLFKTACTTKTMQSVTSSVGQSSSQNWAVKRTYVSVPAGGAYIWATISEAVNVLSLVLSVKRLQGDFSSLF